MRNNIHDNINKNVVSFPAGGTYNLVEKYFVHAHPIKKGYPKNIMPYIAIRQTGGSMNAVFKVVETIDIIPKNIEWEKINLISNHMIRLKGYVKERIQSYGFTKEEIPYRFYFLELFERIEPAVQLKPNTMSYKYYCLEELVGEIENMQKDPLETIVYDGKEGKQIQYYVTKYERNPVNREAALKIHGYTCQVCGFNFEQTYGKLGKEFVEVHHNKPLYSLDEEVVINPELDLVCVCSNCHRMLHRKRNEIVFVEELKAIIKN